MPMTCFQTNKLDFRKYVFLFPDHHSGKYSSWVVYWNMSACCGSEITIIKLAMQFLRRRYWYPHLLTRLPPLREGFENGSGFEYHLGLRSELEMLEKQVTPLVSSF